MVSGKSTTRFIVKAQTGRHSIAIKTRDLIYERDNYICQYCKRKFDRSHLSIEHVVPISKGGIDEIINYITVCRSCNSSKSATDLKDFVEKNWNIQISELPIHGDIIMDTPELGAPYRLARQRAYYIMRRDGTLRGSEALKRLEKLFRSILWSTDYGTILAKRFPNIPGHVRISIPLVEFIESDSRKPVFNLLIELIKSANTRALVDDIVRTLANNKSLAPEIVIRSILFDKYDNAMQKRIEQAFKRAKLGKLDNIFDIPTKLENIPVKPGEILLAKIVHIENNVGFFLLDNYKIQVKNSSINNEYEIVIDNVYKEYAEAHIAFLPNE